MELMRKSWLKRNRCARCDRMSWKGGRPCGVRAIMANWRGRQERLISSMLKKVAGSPPSVNAGAWMASGREGGDRDCSRTWAKEGATTGVGTVPASSAGGETWASPPRAAGRAGPDQGDEAGRVAPPAGTRGDAPRRAPPPTGITGGAGQRPVSPWGPSFRRPAGGRSSKPAGADPAAGAVSLVVVAGPAKDTGGDAWDAGGAARGAAAAVGGCSQTRLAENRASQTPSVPSGTGADNAREREDSAATCPGKGGLERAGWGSNGKE